MVKHRNIFLVILLSAVTFGIYPIVMMCKINNEVNRICEGDGKQPMHYIFAWLLGGVTLNIFTTIWVCKMIERLRAHEYRYGVHVGHTGKAYALWYYLGSFIVVGPIIALASVVDSVNTYAPVYGVVQPLPYSEEASRAHLQAWAAGQTAQPQPAQIPVAPVAPVAPVVPVEQEPPVALTYEQSGSAPVAPAGNPDDTVPLAAYSAQAGVAVAGEITCVAGAVSNTNFAVNDGDVVIVGKDPASCNLVVSNEAAISRSHCSIKYDGMNGVYYVTDDSTNGTYLQDGTKLVKGNPTCVAKGSQIYLANRNTTFALN